MSVDVVVYYRPWAYDKQVEANDSLIMRIDHITGNGHTLHTFSPQDRQLMELLEKGSEQFEFDQTPPFELSMDAFAVLTVRHMTDETWAYFSPEDWVEGSSQEECALLVRSLEVVHLPVEDPATLI